MNENQVLEILRNWGNEKKYDKKVTMSIIINGCNNEIY